MHLGPHHLLHGKFANLQKPYAVIRKAMGQSGGAAGTTLEGDASDEEIDVEGIDDKENGATSAKKRRQGGSTEKKRQNESAVKASVPDDEEEDDPPLFAADPDIFPSTPMVERPPASSSPFYPASAPRDYSSELDPASSPARWEAEDDNEEDGDEQERAHSARILEEEKRRRVQAREKRKRDERERTRSYEVVGIVRKKVVFHLR